MLTTNPGAAEATPVSGHREAVDDYAPFPERELRGLYCALMHVAERLGEHPSAQRAYEDADVIYQTLTCYAALRERCLTAELRLAQLGDHRPAPTP